MQHGYGDSDKFLLLKFIQGSFKSRILNALFVKTNVFVSIKLSIFNYEGKFLGQSKFQVCFA